MDERMKRYRVKWESSQPIKDLVVQPGTLVSEVHTTYHALLVKYSDLAEGANAAELAKLNARLSAEIKVHNVVTADLSAIAEERNTLADPPRFKLQVIMPSKPALSKLNAVNDLLPSPTLRKRLKKMMADQAAHIEELRAQGKWKSAKWIAASTWMLWAWYVFKSPLTSLLNAAKRVVG